jgi:hypothetical protein
MLQKAISFCLISFVAGCFQKSSDSVAELKIDYGITLTTASKNSAEGVVYIGNCSATVVSDHALITAAHCVDGYSQNADGSLNGTVRIFTGYAAGAQSTKLYMPSRYLTEDDLKYAFDIALAIFPAGTFRSFHSVETNVPKLGDDLVMVGYSAYVNGVDLGAAATKRWGKNKISSFRREITIVSDGCTNSSCVVVSPGDSGGPAFNKCQLVGVTSRMNFNGNVKQSFHTNVTYDGVTSWLKEMKDKGGYVCGFHGNDPTYCDPKKRIGVTNPAPTDPEEFTCTVGVASNLGDSGNSGGLQNPPGSGSNPGAGGQVGPSISPSPNPGSQNPAQNRCACGVAQNQFGLGCVIERTNPAVNQQRFLVESGSAKMCQTEELCRQNYSDYLNDKQMCPDGWFFGKASDQQSSGGR